MGKIWYFGSTYGIRERSHWIQTANDHPQYKFKPCFSRVNVVKYNYDNVWYF